MIIKPIGQGKIIGFFEEAIRNNSLGHAYIIEGDEGSGKSTLASFLAAVATCEKGTFCGECKMCKQSMADANPDIISVSAEGQASLKIEVIRDLLDKLSFKSFHGGRRVIIIEDADIMTTQAQNALLKSIEEPSAGTVFLILCKRASYMLPTITSRTQTLTVAPLGVDDLKKIAPDCSDFEYRYCNGNPGVLKRISADGEFRDFRNTASQVIASVICGDEDKLYDCAEFFEANKDRKTDLMTVLTLLIRDVLYKKSGLDSAIVNTDMIHLVNSISARCTLTTCTGALTEILEAEGGVLSKYSSYPMAIQAMLIKVRDAFSKQEDN